LWDAIRELAAQNADLLEEIRQLQCAVDIYRELAGRTTAVPEVPTAD
jgi:hypothetical protein